jgi:hypothetical protein
VRLFHPLARILSQPAPNSPYAFASGYGYGQFRADHHHIGSTMTDEPTRQAIAAKERSGKLTVSGKLKIAIDLMLEGSRRPDAATAAGLKDHSVREAMKKAHVRAYWNHGLQVLRESERARNIITLVAVRDGEGHSNPIARVSAAKALEQIADPALPGGSGGGRRSGYLIDLREEQAPGLVIVVNQHTAPRDVPGLTIDVSPNKADDDE